MTTVRLLCAIVMVFSVALLADRGARPKAGQLAPRVLNAPYHLGAWRGADAAPLDPEVERAIAADRILNRDYVTPEGAQASLYIAYYGHQRPGVSIHSPLLCLPGTGWNVLSNDVAAAAVLGRTGSMRRLVAEKDATRVMILYWYAIHGRMIANDFESRMQLFSDRIRLGQNDASLVRVVVPVQGSLSDAERSGQAFIAALGPYL